MYPIPNRKRLKRRLLRLSFLLTAVLGSACNAPRPSSGEATETPKLNIVFILLDDLRYDAMGFLWPGLETPNIDQLAAEGVYFPNAVVTTSLCSPSRATLLTGLTTRKHGVIDNNEASEADLTYFPSFMQTAGYQTGFFGKWHMGRSTDAPRPGFDRWVSFAGQGYYFPTQGLAEEQVSAGEVHMLNVDDTAVPQSGYITDELTDYAIDWLESGRDPDKPFFLMLSHKAVHSDFRYPERYADQYTDLDIDLPVPESRRLEATEGKPMWVQNQKNSWHGIDFPYHTDIDFRETIRHYLRAISPVDDSLGRIRSYLREAGLEDSTLIVFTSDNGFLFGEHGLIDKRNAYEPSVRVPMILWAPGNLPAGVTNVARIRNLDVAPTLLNAAGIEPSREMEGQSFLAVAAGDVSPEDWNPADFIYTYFWEWTFPHTPTTFSITRNNIKYIQYHGVWDTEELYDLAADPDELVNLINEPSYRVQRIELRQRLFDGLSGEDGEHAVPYTRRNAEGIVWRSQSGATGARFPDRWLNEPNRSDRLSAGFADTIQ